MMKRAVITGANGSLGASLVQLLLAQNIEVLALVRKGADGAANLPSHPLLRVAVCELNELHAFAPLAQMPAYDVFFHFAWNGTYGSPRDDVYLQSDNIRHTLDAISLAKRLGCSRFIGAGSQAEYGLPPEGEKLTSSTPTSPTSGYGIAKLTAGLLGGLHAKQLGIVFNWVRVLSIYGPMEKPYSLTMSTILSLLRGEETHFTKGGQLWDFLYCDDAARAFLLVAKHGRDGQTYVLGSGQPLALSEAITSIGKSINAQARLGIGDLPYPPNQIMYLCADISLLTADTGFIPQIPYAQGIAKTIQQVKERL